ncbi:spt2 chromatin protein [Fusarium langsethiae]|uniref:Spt2 chromatin protein n=1 Tax=Fusarium langsethiae TaxID=179993 RepID=A0A0N0V7M7_FUSLA|nr:spt2 chromatin protein [Fusarium langsethiae]
MPIGDLLAQISGGDEGSAPSTTPSLPRSNTLPKRKADDDPRSSISKAPRVTTLSSTVAPRTTESPTTSSRPSLPSRLSDRSTPSQRPSNSTNGDTKPNVLSSKPMNGSNRVSKPAAPSRPSPGPSSAPPAARGAPPKKGSFAEIIARARKAQQSMGQVGKIQHKKVEGGNLKKVRDEPAAKADPRAVKGVKQRPGATAPAPSPASAGYAGTAKPGQRNGTPVSAAGRDPRGRPMPPAKPERGRMTGAKGPGGRAAPPEEEPKKVKKAAAATTGYTGTARPRPGGNPAKKKETPRGGALLSAPRAPRPSHSKSRFEDDYDEDMDDFIDYDDEDDEGGPRYDYASDASSDMEAGLDDIDGEERRAELIARREDIEEERLERKLKADKEARKRQALEQLRASRR